MGGYERLEKKLYDWSEDYGESEELDDIPDGGINSEYEFFHGETRSSNAKGRSVVSGLLGMLASRHHE